MAPNGKTMRATYDDAGTQRLVGSWCCLHSLALYAFLQMSVLTLSLVLAVRAGVDEGSKHRQP